jgi:hypothetical protein
VGRRPVSHYNVDTTNGALGSMLSADNMVLIDVVPPRVVVSGQHSVVQDFRRQADCFAGRMLLRFNAMDHARFPPA